MTQQTVLYETVADSISGMISAGTLRPGERVPSVRRLSTQRRVSVATVLRAYEVLENRGLIEARPNAGYYVRHRKPVADEPSISNPPVAPRLVGISALVQEVLDSRRPDVVSFGAACPGPDHMPTAKLQRTISSIARRNPLVADADTCCRRATRSCAARSHANRWTSAAALRPRTSS